MRFPQGLWYKRVSSTHNSRIPSVHIVSNFWKLSFHTSSATIEGFSVVDIDAYFVLSHDIYC